MGLTLAFAVVTGALIAGDPDMEWSTDVQPSGPPEPSPAPAPPPPADRRDDVPEAGVSLAQPERPALDKNFRLMVELDVGASPSSMGQLGLGAELDWYALRFVRLHASIGASWIPVANYFGLSHNGAMKLFAGVDGVLPFSWGELFMGLESGAAYTNASNFPQCFDCGGFGYSTWDWTPALRVRGGFEVTVARPLVLGVDVGYGLFTRQWNEVHWAELHGRIGYAF